MKPHGWLIDDSSTYRPWYCQDAEHAKKVIRSGKSVTPLYTHPLNRGRPPKDAHDAHIRAQLVLRDHEAMKAIARIRELSGVGNDVDLMGVADALAAKLRMH